MEWVKENFKSQLGVTKEKAVELFNHLSCTRVPFVKQLMEKASNSSTRTRTDPYITWASLSISLCGNLIHSGCIKPLSHEEALREHGPGIQTSLYIQIIKQINSRFCSRYDKKIYVRTLQRRYSSSYSNS